MVGDPLDVYRQGTLARWQHAAGADVDGIDRPGLCGVVEGPDRDRVKLLVTDDRAYDELRGLVAAASGGTVGVFASAARSRALLDPLPEWSGSTSSTAMVRDLGAPPDGPPLPSSLRLHRIRRIDGDPPGDVGLDDAIACVAVAAPETRPDELVAYLRSLPDARLFAAVDEHGAVRATSGYLPVDRHARVMFIDTDPSWQRRGIGTAMTCAALRDAWRSGVRVASLDSSPSGSSVYQRLGFEPVGEVVHFRR